MENLVRVCFCDCSPSQSEPDLANPRRRNRRRAPEEQTSGTRYNFIVDNSYGGTV